MFFSNPLIATKPAPVQSEDSIKVGQHKFCRQTLSFEFSEVTPRFPSEARPVHVFLPCMSGPPYCVTELSVAMVTVVANSNSTVELVLPIALGCCWSWVGMMTGMKPRSPFLFFLESFISPSRLRCWRAADQKLTGNIFTVYSQATSTSAVSSQPLVKDPRSNTRP